MGSNRNNQKAAIKKARRRKKLEKEIAYLKALQPVDSITKPDTVTYGKLIRKYREQAGLSIEGLATKVGITRQSMWAIEKGSRAKIDVELMYVIAVILRCSIDNLTGKTEKRGEILNPRNLEKTDEEYEKEDISTPEIRNLSEAIEWIEYMHPDLAKRIILLARAGDYVVVQKANDLLEAGLREFFYDLRSYTNDI